jgi:hypothetical protein
LAAKVWRWARVCTTTCEVRYKVRHEVRHVDKVRYKVRHEVRYKVRHEVRHEVRHVDKVWYDEVRHEVRYKVRYDEVRGNKVREVREVRGNKVRRRGYWRYGIRKPGGIRRNTVVSGTNNAKRISCSISKA